MASMLLLSLFSQLKRRKNLQKEKKQTEVKLQRGGKGDGATVEEGRKKTDEEQILREEEAVEKEELEIGAQEEEKGDHQYVVTVVLSEEEALLEDKDLQPEEHGTGVREEETRALGEGREEEGAEVIQETEENEEMGRGIGLKRGWVVGMGRRMTRMT